MSWQSALHIEDLPEGQRKVVTLAQRDVLLIHHKGHLYACDNRCPHMGLPLLEGQIDAEQALHCPAHHSAFDLHTGAIHAWSPHPPGVGALLGRLKPRTPLRVYPVEVDEDGTIWVELKDAS